jgi:hypothetical protein
LKKKSESGEKMKKSETRDIENIKTKEEHEEERRILDEKYDINLRDSDDSSDEENLLRTGDVPREWYDLYDHKGYGVDGK